MFRYLTVPITLQPNRELEIQDLDVRFYRKATGMFQSLHRQALLKQLWYRISRQNSLLVDLSVVCQACRISAQFDAGMQNVPLGHVIGSSSRSQDYDPEFRPLHFHLSQRWSKIAALRLMNVSLPAVELIRVGEAYFVVDGHNRISVGRALGQSFIDARVVVWHLEITPGPELIGKTSLAQQLSPGG